MDIYTIVLVEFLLITSSILLLFKYRTKIGLAPLYLFLGAVRYLQGLSGTMKSITVFEDIIIYPESVIIFSSLLFAVLLIYIKEGVSSARALIIGIIISNLLLSALFGIVNIQNLDAIESSFAFLINDKYFIAGTLLLLLDFLWLVVTYQFLVLKLNKQYFFLTLFISLLLVFISDAFLFNLTLYYDSADFINLLIGNIIGKIIAAFVFSLILFFYVKYMDSEKNHTLFIASQDRDVFSIIKYRKKYLDLMVEKQQIEQKLTSQLENTLNNITDGFVSLDTNWCYTYINEKAAEFLGKSPKSLIGKHIWTVFPEGKNLPFHEAFHEAFETQKTIYYEEFYEPFNKWFENRIYPSPEGLTVYFTDITEKKKAAANNQMLLSLIETSTDFIGLATLKGKPIYINSNGRKLVGLETNASLTDSILNFYSKEYQEVMTNAILPKIMQHGNWKGEAHFQNFETGASIPIEMSAFLIKDSISNKPIAIGNVAFDITKRKKAEIALKESEHHLRTILETEPECIKQLSATGELIYMNPAGLAMIEADNLEMVKGHSVIDLIMPSHQRAFKELTKEVFKGNEGQLAFEITGIKGTKRWLETHAVPFKDPEGNIISLLGVTRDITKRKQVEDDLINSEQLFRRLSSNVPVGIFQTDIEGSCNYVNEEWLGYAGMSFEDAMGYGFAEAMHPDDRERVLQSWLGYVKNGGEFNIEFRFQNIKNHKITWLVVNAVGLHDAQNKLYGHIGMTLDITEQKNAEKLLTDSENHLNNIINNIGDPVFVKDDQSRFLIANNAFYSLFNRTKEEILGKTFAEGIPLEERERYLNIDKQVITKGIEIVDEDSFNVEGGEPRFIATKKTRYIDKNGNKFLIGVIRDITERKNAEEEIRMAHQRLTTHLNNSPVAIIEWDKNFIIRNWSSQAKNIFGWEASETIGKHFNDLNLVYEGDAEVVGAITNELISGKVKSNKVINNNYTKTNKIIYCEWYNSALQSADGEIDTIFSLVQDITERIESEENLKESEDKFAKAFESKVVGIAILNKEKKIIEINEEFTNIVGLKKEQIINKGADELGLFNFEYVKNLENETVLWDQFYENGYVSNIDLNYILPGGKELFLIISLQALQLKDEDHILVTILNITDKKKAEIELEKHQNNLEELVARRTEEVNSKNKELQRVNKLFIGRELKMKELKNIIKEMQAKNDN